MRTLTATPLKSWLNPLLIVVLSAAASFTGSRVAHALRYERQGLDEGEVWRLLSGNLVHADFAHWLLNMLALGALWLLYQKFLVPLHALVSIILCALGTTVGLLLFNPELQWYVGLSGALHGFIVVGALIAIDNEPKLQSTVLVLVGIKLIMEQWHGPLAAAQQWISVAVAVDSHLYGALTGVLIGIGFLMRGLWRGKRS